MDNPKASRKLDVRLITLYYKFIQHDSTQYATNPRLREVIFLRDIIGPETVGIGIDEI